MKKNIVISKKSLARLGKMDTESISLKNSYIRKNKIETSEKIRRCTHLFRENKAWGMKCIFCNLVCHEWEIGTKYKNILYKK